MRILIVEDDFLNRTVILKQMAQYGTPDVAVNGKEAVDAVELQLEKKEPYQLICLDILMPEMDGQDALKEIRRLEEKYEVVGNKRSKIIMTTALSGSEFVLSSFRDECDGYLVKPIKLKDIQKLMDVLEIETDE